MKAIEDVISGMSLEQKVGQLFTLGFSGSVVTPEAIEMVTRLHAGGLRVTPNVNMRFKKYEKLVETDSQGKKRDPLPNPTPHMSPDELLEAFNALQQMAASRPCGIPLHIATDVEGGSSADVARGYPLFPAPLGLACADDPDLFYRVAQAIGRLLRATGVNMIHSPVLCVLAHPFSPEINVRSCGDDPEKVTLFAAETLRGFTEEGVIATAKHWPGRGYSCKDVHYEKDVCPLSEQEMMAGELLPYIRLIEKGLPAIMVAHSIYPGLGSELPATISRELVQGVLRDKLGFEGVIETDSITMEGVLEICPVNEACARSIQAGCDLVLYKTERPSEAEDAMATTKHWVEEGRIPQEQIDDSVRRILTMKRNAGLFDQGWRRERETILSLVADEEIRSLSRRAADLSTLLIRDRKGLLPIPPGAAILVVEQAMFLSRFVSDSFLHPYLLWANIEKRYPGAGLVRLEMFGTDEDLAEVVEKAGDFDVIVAGNIYSRGARPNTEFLEKMIAAVDKDVVVVATSPFPAVVADCMHTVFCTFSEMPESVRAAADIIAGDLKPGERLPVRRIR